MEMEEVGSLLVNVNDALSSVECGEGELVDDRGRGCVVVCH